MRRSISIILASAWLSVAQAQAEDVGSVVPAEGFVPDATTAVRVAEAILIPIYGETAITGQKPLMAQLDEDVWHVVGTLLNGYRGGVAEVWIARADGHILRVTHGR